jgi:hypothetical protein
MSKGKKKMEIYGSDIRGGVLREGVSLNGWKLPRPCMPITIIHANNGGISCCDP